ncbi:MAG: signal peptidase I [Lachnospiraceae bacterium]|nr:signal peptidase I [Lachnospiraceae bacterium]
MQDKVNNKKEQGQESEELQLKKNKKKSNKRSFLGEILNWILIIFIAAICGYAVVTFMFQTVTVIGPSMSTTLEDGQVVIVNKMTYSFSDVERFDIIAYSQIESEEYYEIKRVIGLPEETVQIKDGFVYINDVKLENLPFDDRILTSGIADKPITLSKDEYFVLGDNVNNSEDSRYSNVGNISKSEILGKVVYIISPKEDRGKVK